MKCVRFGPGGGEVVNSLRYRSLTKEVGGLGKNGKGTPENSPSHWVENVLVLWGEVKTAEGRWGG